MIPKVIHYCWFGNNPKPELALKCIDSWKKYCPDYEIKEWNEANFDINCCDYVKEAYEAKKWAFVTDYVRLFVLYTYGGIYMDTDVEVLENLDKYLKNEAFSGFEDNVHIQTGIIGATANNQWIKININYYKDKHFRLENDELDLTTNVITITKITKDNYNCRLDNTFQNLGDVVLYPRDFFCPKDYLTNQLLYLSSNTVTIHHFDGSWKPLEEKLLSERTADIRMKYGRVTGIIYFNCYQFMITYKKEGLKAALGLLQEKFHRKLSGN